MQCPSCRSDTADNSRFCEACGAGLFARCSSCDAEIRPGARFCSNCGKKIESATTPGPALSPPAPVTASAERRHLTVMFCDLVGSTALSARLDPEDMREVIGAYHRCCAENITKTGGFVAKYMGDGVLAYFGYPRAHEDDAERAVRAALALVNAMQNLHTPIHAALQVRIGVATGLVVVGDLIGEGDAQERGVVGETPNLAARLQAAAEPGQVVISNSTRRLTGGMFEYRDLGTVALKGLSEPAQTWQVISVSVVESRFEAQHGASLPPLVGRAEEIDVLARRWRQAMSGEGRVVLLSGEPGIGKSRLAAELQERLQSERNTRLRYFCSPQHTDSAFYPVISQLERAAQFERQDDPKVKFAKLNAVVGSTSGNSSHVLLLAELLSIPSGDLYQPVTLPPQRKKEKTVEALLAQLEMLSRQQPVLMLFEDVHWIDPSSREILDLTVERVASLPVLLVITYRPEFEPPWTGQAHVTLLSLNRLGRREGAALVGSLAGSALLPTEIMAEIVERTDGIPLFVEELTKSVLEADAADHRIGSPVELGIPATLNASLLARLDRLGAAAKEVAQVGAVLGREFSYDLLVEAARRPDQELREGARRLAESGIVFCRGVLPNASFSFKHALVRDAAYESLLKTRRRLLHRRVAEVLARSSSDDAAFRPEVVAHHFTQAGMSSAAFEWWGKAGERALRASAHKEAVSHLKRALDLAAQFGEGSEFMAQRMRMQTMYGQALLHASGFTAAETKTAFVEARELASRIADPSEKFSAYYGIWVQDTFRGDLTRAHELATSFLEEATPQSAEAGVAHRLMGTTLFLRGEFSLARHHLEIAEAISTSKADGIHAWAVRLGHDLRCSVLLYLGLLLWPMGQIDRATQLVNEGLALAEGSQITNWLIMYCYGCFFAGVCGKLKLAFQCAQAAEGLAREHGLPLWLAYATFFVGWSRVAAGDQNGAAKAHEGWKRLHDLDAHAFRPLIGTLLAQMDAKAGHFDKALKHLRELAAESEADGQTWFDSEIYRAQGEVLLTHPVRDVEAAEAAFIEATEIAQGQMARAFELRAATSLARLWRDQGKRTEAHDLLAPIYGWFTEGFDTPDLKDAKALLEELS